MNYFLKQSARRCKWEWHRPQGAAVARDCRGGVGGAGAAEGAVETPGRGEEGVVVALRAVDAAEGLRQPPPYNLLRPRLCLLQMRSLPRPPWRTAQSVEARGGTGRGQSRRLRGDPRGERRVDPGKRAQHGLPSCNQRSSSPASGRSYNGPRNRSALKITWNKCGINVCCFFVG